VFLGQLISSKEGLPLILDSIQVDEMGRIRAKSAEALSSIRYRWKKLTSASAHCPTAGSTIQRLREMLPPEIVGGER
jgi:hypothetical protein